MLNVTTVSATGTVETEFDSAVFTVSTNAKAAKASQAREELKKASKAIAETVAKFDDFVSTSTKKASVNVSPNFSYDKNGHAKQEGYVAAYSLTFKLKSLDLVNEVHDALCALDNVMVASPVFKCSKSEEFQSDALKKAFDLVKNRFLNECAILGMDPTDFVVAAWQVHYRQEEDRGFYAASSRSVAAASPMLESVQDGIESGKAKVTANLSVTYAKKE